MVYKIGMLGYKFMGKAHSNALTQVKRFFSEAPEVELSVICGRNEKNVSKAASRFGFNRYTTDWEDLTEDEEVDIFVNLGPNHMHEKPSIRALRNGKHVLCEKPLSTDLKSVERMAEASKGVESKTACGFNYRFVPAIKLANELIEGGEIGEIRHFRGLYLQDWLVDPESPWSWRTDKKAAESGALGDIGSHTIDLANYLVGEIKSVSGHLETFVDERPSANGEMKPVTVDDAYSMQAIFENGAMGVFEASRFATGNKNNHRIEVHGSDGSVRFSLERLNELEVYKRGEDEEGYKTVLVTEEKHPFMQAWWPPGHVIGWEHTFIHEWYAFLSAISEDEEFYPNFEDGLEVQKAMNAAKLSEEKKEWIDL